MQQLQLQLALTAAEQRPQLEVRQVLLPCWQT